MQCSSLVQSRLVWPSRYSLVYSSLVQSTLVQCIELYLLRCIVLCCVVSWCVALQIIDNTWKTNEHMRKSMICYCQKHKASHVPTLRNTHNRFQISIEYWTSFWSESDLYFLDTSAMSRLRFLHTFLDCFLSASTDTGVSYDLLHVTYCLFPAAYCHLTAV